VLADVSIRTFVRVKQVNSVPDSDRAYMLYAEMRLLYFFTASLLQRALGYATYTDRV